MTLEQQILADLSVGRSTADSIAGRIDARHVTAEAVAVILKRLERDGKVAPSPLKHLTVWQLTTAGHEAAQ